MSGGASYRELLRSTTLMGGASVVNVAIAILTAKVLAMLAGPHGIGLYGLYGGLVATIANWAGIGTGGVRAIAAAHARSNRQEQAIITQALFWIALGTGIPVALAVFFMRRQLAGWIFDDAGQAHAIGILSIAIFMALWAASFTARLSGTGRLARLAQISIAANLTAALAMLAGVRIIGLDGIVISMLVTQATTLALSYLALRRPALPDGPGPLLALRRHGGAIVRTGVALSASASLSGLSLLVVRGRINHVLGPEAMGNFQAAWSISMTYIGFVLAAIALDYFPRLTGMSGEPALARRLLNQQTTLALVVTAPIFLFLFVFSPLVVRALYSSEFAPTVAVLRWQILGDALKVASWPLGYLLLAMHREKRYLLTEIAWNLLFVSSSWLLMPMLGVEATGVAFAASYAAYLALMLALVRRELPGCWNLANRLIATSLVTALGALVVIQHAIEHALLPLGGALTLLSGVCAAFALRHMLSIRRNRATGTSEASP